MTLLNVAEICVGTKTLGPGQRFVIWVQGCCFNCNGCVSPEWIPQKQATLLDPQQLGNYILSIPGIEGITVSGGEPMLQAASLSTLFTYLRQYSDLSIICFSGFTLKQLSAKSDPNINNLLNLIDVLIDGQYIKQLDDNKGWRGSSNQNIHFLTPRYLPQANLFSNRKRDIEIHMQDDSALMVGLPPKNFSEDFRQVV